MDGSTLHIGTSIHDTSKFINVQDNVLAEETESVLSRAPEEALKGQLNPEESTTEMDSGLEEYIEYVIVREMMDTFDPQIFNSNSEKISQAVKDVKTKKDRPKLVVDASGRYKYKCTGTKCAKTYTSMYDAETHIKIKHNGLENECVSCGENFSKRGT